MEDWSRIRDQYGPLVWKTAYRILVNHADALDCCQDVFAELLGVAGTRDVRNWAGFLRWLTACRALSRLKRRRVDEERTKPLGDLACLPAAGVGAEDQAEWNELIECLRRALARIPELQSQAFWLHAIEQMSQAEIAEQMGIDTNGVGVLVHRARKRLREALVEFKPLKQ